MNVEDEGAGVMPLAGFALRRPRLVLLLWLCATTALAFNGTQLASHIAPTSIEIPGTPAQQASQLAKDEIGVRGQAPVLLEGPSVAVRAQAQRLASTLREDPQNVVLTGLDPGAPNALRPPGAIVVLVERPTDETFGPGVIDAVRPVVEAEIRRPVRASLSGFSAIGSAISDETVHQAHAAEKLALPVLLLVLLIVFRSPLGAAIPALLGGVTVLSGLGLADLVARTRDVTDVCTPIASMLGLALGVDYSLLMVSRFREARRAGLDVETAAATATQTAGRTVVVAGGTLVATMAVALLLAPGTFLQSAAVGAAAAATVAVLSALTAVPAALVLLGSHLERWRFGGPPNEEGRVRGVLADVILRHPVRCAVPAVAILVALAIPGVGLDAGPPDVRVLPADSPVRVDTERIVAKLGRGWTAPLELLAVDRTGALARADGRRVLAEAQARLSRDPDVALLLPRQIGRTVSLTVVPRAGPNEPATARLYDRARRMMGNVADQTGARTAVGGVAAQLTDYRREFRERLPWLVVALSLVAYLALVLVLRALLLPLISVVLNALVLAGAFGVLALLGTGDAPPLGGSGFADALSLLALLSLIFGLSLDYQVFILTRLREGYLATSDTAAAIRSAIVQTGPVILGAAAIMSGVFAAFITPDLQTIRQTGTGLVATVLLAGTLVCLVLLPAALRIVGPAALRLPKWLDRRLPEVNVDGDTPSSEPPAVGRLALRSAGPDRWTAELCLRPADGSGFGQVVSPGALSAALDEIFARAATDDTDGAHPVTLRTSIEYHAPLPASRLLQVHTEMLDTHRGRRELTARLLDGPVRVTATATVYVVAGPSAKS